MAPPDIALKANGAAGSITIPAGTSATLEWNSMNMIPGSCLLNQGLVYPQSLSPANGTISTGPVNTNKVFVITCSPRGGGPAMPASVAVNVEGGALSGISRTIRVTNPGSYYASGQTATILFETTGNISRVKWELCEGANGTAPCRLMSGDVAVTGRAAYIYWWPQAGDWYVGKALWVKVSDVSSQATGSAGPFYILRQ